MADIDDRAVIAMVGTAIDQQVAATLGPHMAQSHGFELANFGNSHADQFARPSAFGQHRCRVSSRARLPRGRLFVRGNGCLFDATADGRTAIDRLEILNVGRASRADR